MTKQYIKVTVPELGACAVSIYSCPPNITESNVCKFVTDSQRRADRQGLKAEYELSTAAEYAEHRAMQKAAIVAAQALPGSK